MRQFKFIFIWYKRFTSHLCINCNLWCDDAEQLNLKQLTFYSDIFFIFSNSCVFLNKFFVTPSPFLITSIVSIDCTLHFDYIEHTDCWRICRILSHCRNVTYLGNWFRIEAPAYYRNTMFICLCSVCILSKSNVHCIIVFAANRFSLFARSFNYSYLTLSLYIYMFIFVWVFLWFFFLAIFLKLTKTPRLFYYSICIANSHNLV